jgi:hypothetical protein
MQNDLNLDLGLAAEQNSLYFHHSAAHAGSPARPGQPLAINGAALDSKLLSLTV